MSQSGRIRCLYAAFGMALAIGAAIVCLPGIPAGWPWESAQAHPSAENSSANDGNGAAVFPVIRSAAELDRLLSRDHLAIYIDADWSMHAKIGLRVIERAIQLERKRPAKQRAAATFFRADVTRGYDAPLYEALLKRGVDRNHFSSGAGPLLVFRRGELVDVIDCVGCLSAEEFIDRYQRIVER